MTEVNLEAKKLQETPATRVTALDAADLDSEIQRILKEQLLKVVHTFSPSWGKWEPELDLFLQLFIWKYSLYQSGSTFGQQLLSVRYSHRMMRHRAMAWAALSVGSRYLHQRSPELAALFAQPQQRDMVLWWIDKLELTVQIATLVNFLMYLRNGLFPSVVDRLVGIKPVTATSASRVVGYRYMTRELLWHGFIELIVFILPFVNFRWLERRIRGCLGFSQTKNQGKESLIYTAATKCAVCQEPPTLPHHMGCTHAFCYYCLQSNRVADIKFECPVCGHSTEDIEAVQPVTSSHCSSS